jgi:hypothetical protein
LLKGVVVCLLFVVVVSKDMYLLGVVILLLVGLPNLLLSSAVDGIFEAGTYFWKCKNYFSINSINFGIFFDKYDKFDKFDKYDIFPKSNNRTILLPQVSIL